MASNIDTAIPPLGTPTTAGVRSNFGAAKTEIEALQGRVGYADYNDSATSVTPISVSASTWTKLTNDKLGPYTRVRLPTGVTNLWNSSTNQLVLTELPVDTTVDLRIDITVTTTAVNQVIRSRGRFAIGDPVEFYLEGSGLQFKTAGTQKVVFDGSFYIGSDAMRLNPGEFQIWSDASATVVVSGWYFRIIKAI